MTPLSLYVHIPWCIRKCPYCDFNSHAVGAQAYDEALYVGHLLADLRAARDEFLPQDGRALHSIFIGGGTPSLFSAAAIARLLQGIRAEMDCEAGMEITLEANPATWEQDKFAGYLQAGINRLSLGVQSFQPQHLQALGRVHRRDEALQAIETAQRVGFKRLNIDLMFALPQQSPADALEDLRTALQFQPEHVSWYQLTIEPNTAFYRQPPPLPDEDAQQDIYEAGSALLRQKGFQQYEVSAWTQGEACRHNLNYWRFGDYLGIGAGAHGKISRGGEIWRHRQFASPVQYQRAPGKKANPYTAQRWTVPPAERAFEFMLNALRLREGVPWRWLEERGQAPPEFWRAAVKRLQGQKLLRDDPERLQATALGFAHLNRLLDAFL